jgi:hypothetical protein
MPDAEGQRPWRRPPPPAGVLQQKGRREGIRPSRWSQRRAGVRRPAASERGRERGDGVRGARACSLQRLPYPFEYEGNGGRPSFYRHPAGRRCGAFSLIPVLQEADEGAAADGLTKLSMIMVHACVYI